MRNKGQKLYSIATEDNTLRVSQVEVRVGSKAHASFNIVWHKYQVNFCHFASLNKKHSMLHPEQVLHKHMNQNKTQNIVP